MKLSQLILALSVSISGAAFAADNHGHEHIVTLAVIPVTATGFPWSRI